jgi:hypothetical protein
MGQSIGSRAGFESESGALSARAHVDSRTGEPPRVDVSARFGVDLGPSAERGDRDNVSDRSLGETSVEGLLARALEHASAAGEWGVVAQLARELEPRRQAGKL